MQTILVTSGFAPAVLTELRRHWHVVDIEVQREALVYLARHQADLPRAVVIGKAFASPPDDGDLDARSMLREIVQLDRELPVIVSTKTSEPGMIVELTKAGAHDYLIEPPSHSEPHTQLDFAQRLVLSLSRAVQYRNLVHDYQQLKSKQLTDLPFGFVAPVSAKMRQAIDMAAKVAPTPATVLITGESGTGKELLARFIHNRSSAAKLAFTAINCGAMNDQLLASEMFGHLKGSFTGAESTRNGLLQETGQGTLFLDEVGTISPAFQIHLLRVLEARTARPVGGSRDFPVTCRFIAAANQDLHELVREGKFREDLWYRFNVFRIHLPPLRERREDIPALAHHYLQTLAAQYGKPITHFSPDAMKQLEAFDWPGNVRQLRNTIERAVIVAERDRIDCEDLDVQPRTAPSPLLTGRRAYRDAMRSFESQLLSAAVAEAGGNLTRAAERLQIKRTTLSYRLRVLKANR